MSEPLRQLTRAERAIKRVSELNHLVRRLNRFGQERGLASPRSKAGKSEKDESLRPYDVGDDAL